MSVCRKQAAGGSRCLLPRLCTPWQCSMRVSPVGLLYA
jgi:hypothetical protein